ncbi:UNVERIFIED_CONTAM: hypothetical protein FKN15_063444 [Acipenser sinensis]
MHETAAATQPLRADLKSMEREREQAGLESRFKASDVRERHASKPGQSSKDPRMKIEYYSPVAVVFFVAASL